MDLRSTISGRLYHFIPYNVNADGVLDYEEIRRLALEHQPKMIVAGASAYPREIRFDLFAEIAKEVGAYPFRGYGTYRRACCGRTSSESGTLRRCGIDDDA